MRRGAQRALGVGAALIAMAAVGGARADVRFFDECSENCIPSATDAAAAVEDQSAVVTLSRFGGGGTEASSARPDLILDPAGLLPSVLLSGPPSPIASAGAQAFDGPGISPYAFFAEVIDVPLSVEMRSGLSGAALFLFAPSTIGRLTLTDLLSNGNELFKPPIIPITPMQPAL